MFNDNDKCWCQSGDDFAECHKNRHLERVLTSEERRALAERVTIPDQCLHPLASPLTCSDIIGAHTIQRKGPLAQIIGADNHVWAFDGRDRGSDGLLALTKIGWKLASVFPGFCQNHDGPFFHDIENEPFIGNQKQCYLFGYRAICHEVHKKLVEIKVSDESRRYLDKGKRFTDQVDLQSDLNLLEFGLKKGLEEITTLRTKYNKGFLTSDYSDYNFLTISFDGDLSIASVGPFNPDFDMKGNRLQDIKNFAVAFEGMVVATAVTPTGGAFVFSWPKSFTSCTSWAKSLLVVGDTGLPSLLVELLFTYVENTYFAKVWWDSLDAAKQERVRKLASIPMAYETFEPCSKMDFVDWTVTNKTHLGI